MKNKIKELKEAMSNPPPERLAKIEYQSHFLQIIGITFVCIALLVKGFWYIIFAFIFGTGISYAQGMTAYRKYIVIKSMTNPEQPHEFEDEKSPTRRRSKIIEYVIPQSKWLAVISSVILTILSIDPTLSRWILMLVYPMTLGLYFIGIYFFILYWICYPIYKWRVKV